MKQLDPKLLQKYKRVRQLLNPYNRQCRVPFKNILYQRFNQSNARHKSQQKKLKTLSNSQQKVNNVITNNKINQILEQQKRKFYQQKIKYNKLYQKNLHKLQNSKYYDLYLENKKRFQQSKTRQRLLQFDARSGRSQFQNYLLKNYPIIQNSKWLTKIVKSKFFYYLLIYKVIAWTLKLLFVIYFWDHYFGKNKIQKNEKTEGNN